MKSKFHSYLCDSPHNPDDILQPVNYIDLLANQRKLIREFLSPSPIPHHNYLN